MAKSPVTLEALIAQIQQRWGHRAIHRARELEPEKPALATGIVPLDRLLGGGLLVGRITTFVGVATSGITTIAYHTIAQTHMQNQEAVYIDIGETFNPIYAASCGIDSERLIIACPADAINALALALDIINSHVVSLLVLDIVGVTEPLPLQRLQAVLHSSPTALLLLTDAPQKQSYMAVRITCQRWLYRGEDVTGCRILAMLEHHPARSPGQRVEFDLIFHDGDTGA